MDRLLNRLCASLAALALFAIMALTFVDVLGRKLASHSLTGALELTEILMVVVIFAALPLVSRQGEHVVFDSLDRFWGRGFLRVQRLVVDLVCAALLAGLSWLMWDKAGQMLAFGDTSAQLQLKLGWFVYLMSVLCAITALVHLALALKPAEPRHPGI